VLCRERGVQDLVALPLLPPFGDAIKRHWVRGQGYQALPI